MSLDKREFSNVISTMRMQQDIHIELEGWTPEHCMMYSVLYMSRTIADAGLSIEDTMKDVMRRVEKHVALFRSERMPTQGEA